MTKARPLVNLCSLAKGDDRKKNITCYYLLLATHIKNSLYVRVIMTWSDVAEAEELSDSLIMLTE